ncbi:MAG: hypothetical protein ACK55I_33710, partial [bacterium]
MPDAAHERGGHAGPQVGETVEAERSGGAPAAGHRLDRRREDLGEPVEDGLGVGAGRNTVAAKPGPPQHLLVEGRVAIQGHDPLHE